MPWVQPPACLVRGGGERVFLQQKAFCDIQNEATANTNLAKHLERASFNHTEF